MWEAEITPECLSGLRDLVLYAEYEGTSAKATIDGRLISDHAYGQNLFWEVGLGDWIGEGGLLRIEFEGCRKAEVSLRPIVELEAELVWSD